MSWWLEDRHRRVMPLGTAEVIRRRYPIRRPLNIDREGTCDMCGRKELVFPVAGSVVLCGNCLRRLPTADYLRARGLVVKFPAITRRVRCDVCGAWSPALFLVSFRKLCFRCMWYVLGKQRHRLSIDGTRIV